MSPLHSFDYLLRPSLSLRAVQAVSKWCSFDDIKFAISPSVRGLILDLFQRLEARHGEELVHATLGYITLCQARGCLSPSWCTS